MATSCCRVLRVIGAPLKPGTVRTPRMRPWRAVAFPPPDGSGQVHTSPAPEIPEPTRASDPLTTAAEPISTTSVPAAIDRAMSRTPTAFRMPIK